MRKWQLTRREAVRLSAAVAATPWLFADKAFAAGLDPSVTVRALARETRSLYHDEAAAHRIADHLLKSLRNGGYAKTKTAAALAEALNREVAVASRDIHFMIMSGDMGSALVPPTPPHSPTPPLTEAELEHLREVNFGIAAAEILAGNVGRLDLRQFYRPAPQVREKYRAAMTLLADTSALIVDLSQNPGGDPRTVAHVLSYFFDRPGTVLNRFYWRNLPVEEFKTDAELAGPRYGESRPIVVQVSANSYSAAEEFAYDLQAFKRGTVVGATTGGGANHALPVTLPGGLQAFIPQARAENPITRSNWEQVGVKPDVAVDGDAAVAAHRVALEQIIARSSARRAKRARDALSRLERVP